SYKSYEYDGSYISPYAQSGAALGNTSFVFTSDGDGSAPDFAVVSNPIGEGSVLSMTGKTDYPMYKLNFKGDVLSKPGKYTVIVSAYKGSEPISAGASCWFNVNNTSANLEVGNITLGSSAFTKSTFSLVIGTSEEYAAGEVKGSLLSGVKMFTRLANGKTALFDDIELWYEEYADITFVLDGEVSTVTALASEQMPITHKSYAPGTALPLIDVTGTGYTFAGWSKTADGSGIITEAEAGCYTLYAVYEKYTDEKATAFENDITGEYGTLIYRQDFEGSDDYTAYSYNASYVSPYADSGAMLGNSNYVYTSDGDKTNPTFAVVENPVGDGYVLSMTGVTTYPIYRTVFDGNVISKPGKYTIVVNALKGTATAAVLRPRFNGCLNGASNLCSIGLGTDSFYKTAASFTVKTKEQFDASGLADTDYTRDYIYTLRDIYMFLDGGQNKTVYFDDIELWYEEYADITFHLDGEESYIANAALEVFPVTHQSIEPGETLPTFTLSGVGYKFVGWSETADG
ncbi:MAG: InlB B-repeat-containing protein, partial [Clostridia bacterium]|nr:InlB B-repeat-containing protein [Clostridia bacterium]